MTLEKDGSATIADNGRGVPVDLHATGVSAARVVYTTLHAGGKFDDSAYKTSGGLHGVGSSVVNALSTYMDVQISRDGYIHHDRYERGKPVIELEDGLLPTIGKTRKTGTKVNFLPDDKIFEKTKFKAEEVKSRMHETAYLNPKLTAVRQDAYEMGRQAAGMLIRYIDQGMPLTDRILPYEIMERGTLYNMKTFNQFT